VVEVSMGEHDALHVSGMLADGSECADDLGGGALEAAVDEGHRPVVVDEGIGVDVVAERGDPVDTGT
jgi:hypothetical protein